MKLTNTWRFSCAALAAGWILISAGDPSLAEEPQTSNAGVARVSDMKPGTSQVPYPSDVVYVGPEVHMTGNPMVDWWKTGAMHVNAGVTRHQLERQAGNFDPNCDDCEVLGRRHRRCNRRDCPTCSRNHRYSKHCHHCRKTNCVGETGHCSHCGRLNSPHSRFGHKIDDFLVNASGRFGYFLPTGGVGHGVPFTGHYGMVYSANPQYFDSRDGQIFAAQGWGAPMAVPLAPNVEHTYNYGWGIPSSRLTPISRVAPEVRYIPGSGGYGFPYRSGIPAPITQPETSAPATVTIPSLQPIPAASAELPPQS